MREIEENHFRGITNRLFQLLARLGPGAETLRVWLHRARGVRIGKNVWIGYDVIMDTSQPYRITIEDGVSISMRVTIIAHFHEMLGVKISRNAFIGPGAIILPNVTIGEGAVVTAGSVVSKSVPPMTIVQGNPAVPVARCGIPLTMDVSLKQFTQKLSSIRTAVPVQEKKQS
jgi:acetyltransferase-like isoleucine patch superfamily enzyme